MKNSKEALREASILYIKVFSITGAISVFLSLFILKSLSGTLEILGNLSLIEAAVFFIIGGMKNVFHSPSVSTFRGYFKLGESNWTIEEMKKAEKKGLVYIITASALIAGNIILYILF